MLPSVQQIFTLCTLLLISRCSSLYEEKRTIDEVMTLMAGRAEDRRLQTIPYNGTSGGVADLRKRLLQDYDKFSYPFEHYWALQGKRTGLPIELTINFHRIFAVEVTESIADLSVWVRQIWNDPRLVWDPSEYNNITTLQMWVSNGMGMNGNSEIWTPDLHLWNAAEPLATSLADAHALVYSDGTVFWARPGHLRPACKFDGLNKFPFDTLSCTIEIGSWAYSGIYLRPVKLDEGFTKGGSITAGEAYVEFTLTTIDCESYGTLFGLHAGIFSNACIVMCEEYPPFPGAPGEDWPVMLYNVKLTRAWQPYVRNVLLLQVLLNCIGFSTFWLPPQTGERMGLSITALLAAVASQLVVEDKIPAFGEVSWFSQFSLVSLIFTALALLENIVVLYLHYHTGSGLVPRYLRMSIQKLQQRRTKVEQETSPSKMERVPKSQAILQHGTSGPLSEERDARPAIDDNSQQDSHVTINNAVPRTRLSEQRQAHVDTTEKVDDGSVMSDNADQDLRDLADSTVNLSRRIIAMDADDFKNDRETENNARWQWYAKTIDDIARISYPVFYSIFLAVKFTQADMK
jgi:Neurotransmitter-gated ion-channel ligand binding domain/Neurotransmitter-gated ion-channel transmembrane region